MAIRFFQRATAIAALLSTALAQTPNIIPEDLRSGFDNEEVQVSFSSNAVTGFASGTTFSKDAVSNEPTFALGDSNGISPSTLYTLIMVDTTCPSARTLHYARSNFKFAFAGGTNIETESAPLLDYKAPGTFQEQGDARQYVFLMYTNPQRREIRELRLPAEGEPFDVQKFQADNALKNPVAGYGSCKQFPDAEHIGQIERGECWVAKPDSDFSEHGDFSSKRASIFVITIWRRRRTRHFANKRGPDAGPGYIFACAADGRG
ncbi:hypothetical protein E8E12_011675 [Didymella heteroderae]|uniref:Uncharacterized protein n=1 Tax=Didymella heteroderae TaxID=1769908 RepID=A0A9P4X211_9PLEO|nr:hypothetical protein E8E12_011675 [Didymella heteroderae]